MDAEQERLFGKAWQDWRGSLTREDLEGDLRDLVYAAFQVAWREGYAASQSSAEDDNSER